jgi:hypothetical protein
MMLKNVKTIFYNTSTGKIRDVANIKNASASVENNVYWNNENGYLNDPYEGELFIWICTLFPK